ncbi:MAG: hypothetical protein WCE48_04740 [Steroidobacteraceae bacterium]
MNPSAFRRVAAIVFGIIALAHAARLAMALPVEVGTVSVPVWASWVALLVTGALSVWGFRSRH